MYKYFEKRMKNLKALDISCIKLAVMAFTLWLVSIWPGFNAWVLSISPWWFAGVFVLALIGPTYRFYFKK